MVPLGIIATRLLVVLLEFKHSSRVDEVIVQQHVLMRGPKEQDARGAKDVLEAVHQPAARSCPGAHAMASSALSI